MVDETVRSGGDIAHSIYQEMDDCDFAFAVLTGFNPNVLYELGRLHQASKPTVLLASLEEISKLPFDIRSFSVLTYHAKKKDETRVTAAVGAAVGKLRLALNPATRRQHVVSEGLSALKKSVVTIDFEQIRQAAEAMLGKGNCKTVDIQNEDNASFKGWNQTLRCPGGDKVDITIDLNGNIQRARVGRSDRGDVVDYVNLRSNSPLHLDRVPRRVSGPR